MKYTKLVLLPIEVAEGNFCWGDKRCCSHFDCEGGHPRCTKGLDWKGPKGEGLVFDNIGRVEKPEFCKQLKEVKE